MIDRQGLLSDLQRLLKTLEGDLRDRCATHPEVDASVRGEYEHARAAGRTAQAYEIWREDHLTQAAVAWILACVFVRFLEDNDLANTPRLAGPGARLALARDHHTVYISRHPTETDREYLLSVFRETARLPAMAALFDERHNPLFRLGLSADGARTLLVFWQQIDPATGTLIHDFTDPAWNTRFLGDLYQDLSESARKAYALLQTPEFVEEFILDRTLEPAIQEFGYQAVRLIDPACGSGHFLLGAFGRLFELWIRNEPGTNTRALAQRTLDALHGVDLNPFAIAIARFRLLIAALQASDVRRLADAPGFAINVEVGDSLLHGTRPRDIRGTQTDYLHDRVAHYYESEDAADLRRIFGRQYHVVIGNPPYITPKDAALNQAYRDRFASCHRQYSLAVPFMERFFDLATPGGFVGMITANSFMKREFGKKLIEEFIPRWDLTHVVDTSGVPVPEHGTSTVILLGRHRPPLAPTIRAVMGIRSDPPQIADPSKGSVWTAILAQIDQANSQSEFVTVADLPRASFARHPWSLGGGGASGLRLQIEATCTARLDTAITDVGAVVLTRADEVFLVPRGLVRWWLRPTNLHQYVAGEDVRDWICTPSCNAIFPYDENTVVEPGLPKSFERWLWPYRALLRTRVAFGKSQLERGLHWYTYSMLFAERLCSPMGITFSNVATHNHFALQRAPWLNNAHAPVIKLTAEAREDDHLGLLGLLNSSIACFWFKQVCYCKGVGGINEGSKEEFWERFFEFDVTKLRQFPMPGGSPLDFARRLDAVARQLSASLPDAFTGSRVPNREDLKRARDLAMMLREQMIGLQDDLDWECYRIYGLLDEELGYVSEDIPRVKLGERAFEIALARKIATGEIETKWFERHDSTPITEIPAYWPEDYRRLVERRIETIEVNPSIALIEQPEYKRRWNTEPWEERQERALRGWLLDRLEDARYWPEPRLTSCARLADRIREDAEFIQVAELYRERADFDVTRLVTELVEEEGVPFLPVLRYTPSGMQKRAVWERTWDLQRREDAGEDVGEIALPPKYTSADCRKYWRLRGKLDVPKERFVLYPHAERETDPTPVLGWAGWDALQQAQALATYVIDMKESESWSQRLAPLLTGLLELLPWVKQWHNDVDSVTRLRMGDYFAQFLDEEARALGLTLDNLRRWVPPAGNAGRRRTAR